MVVAMVNWHPIENMMNSVSFSFCNHVGIPSSQEQFPQASIIALRPMQPPVQWVLQILSLGVKQPETLKLTTHLGLVLRLRMSGARPLYP